MNVLELLYSDLPAETLRHEAISKMKSDMKKVTPIVVVKLAGTKAAVSPIEAKAWLFPQGRMVG